MSKRGTRTSEKQFQIYVQFLKENNEFRAGKITAQNIVSQIVGRAHNSVKQLWFRCPKKYRTMEEGKY